MINEMKSSRRSQKATWTVALLAFALLLAQPNTAAAQVTGSGTINKMPKWTPTTTALGDSVITELNGNIGIGTTSPSYKLHIEGPTGQTLKLGTANLINNGMLGELLFTNQNGGIASAIQAWNPSTDWQDFTDLRFFTSNSWGDLKAERMRIDSNGNVGIGATNPATLLHIAAKTPTFKIQTTASAGDSQAAFQTKLQLAYDTLSGDRGEIWYDHYNAQMYIDQVYPGEPFSLSFRRNAGSTGSPNMQTTMTLNGSGNVGIGTTAPSARLHVVGTTSLTGNVSIGTSSSNANLDVQGSVTVSGNIAAKYQDVAEWVPATSAIPAGTVVVLDADQSNHVLPSSRAYDTRVAGVVSAKPGVILGEGGEGKVMVATTGRVRVKVDATRGPIRVGDLLVTSDKEGIAMRSQPLDLGGTPIHRPGTLIGKAIEPLDKGVGEILVLLSLQ